MSLYGLDLLPDVAGGVFTVYNAVTTPQPHDLVVSIPISMRGSPNSLSVNAIQTFFKAPQSTAAPAARPPAQLQQQLANLLVMPQNHTGEVALVINTLFWKLYPVSERLLQDKNSSLWLWVCPITNKPIRHVIKPNEETVGVWYERAALIQWVTDHPTEPPAKWPQGVLYPPTAYQPDHTIQYLIDQVLSKIACRELQRYYTPRNSRQKQERLEQELIRRVKEPTAEEEPYRTITQQQIKQVFEDCHALGDGSEDCFTQFLKTLEENSS